MRIEDEIKLDYKDVLIRPKRSALGSRKEVDLVRHYTFKHSNFEWHGVPIMAANMDGVGTLEMATALYDHRMFTCLVKSYNEDELCDLATKIGGNYFAISTGTSDSEFLKLRRIINAYPEIHFICIDVANGYQERFGDYVQKVRETFPHCTIIAGNVVTADMTQELILRGADIVKVGIGPGAVCTTRIQTGVGYPQLSAIIECADAAHGLGGHIIADGGCTCPGDVAKAFGAGADFVMLGGMLAGHDEGGGDVITKTIQTSEAEAVPFPAGMSLEQQEKILKDVEEGKFSLPMQPIFEKKQFVEFYGMSSDTAMEKHHGGVAEYRSSEGRTVEIPYKGAVKNTILDILGGLRSTCTYVGAPTLKQLPKCTTFIRVNRQINDIFLKG